MANIVGIDLGTTFSAVAHVDDQGRPSIVRNADGKTTTPSVVLIKEGRIEVGEVAVNQWITDQEHVVRWIKRAMGDADYQFQGLTPVQISAEILKVLKREAETAFGEPVAEAVITCPAYFNSIEIENTKLAGEQAGFKVREIIKEPTAAAVYYGVEHMKEGETVLVCDLGGGTYDATVLSYQNRVFSPRASMGDRQLGGHDWTMELVELVASRFQERFGVDPRNDLVAGQMLYEACEQAKRDFARQTEATIHCQHQGRIEPMRVTRDDFEARTEWKIQQVGMWSDAAVSKAGLTWPQIDRILLVGGSSRLRRIRLALEEKSGRPVVETGDPDLMVAYGAAILAAGKVRSPQRGGLVDAGRVALVEVPTERIIARALGTRVIEMQGRSARVVTSEIIPHSTRVPESGLSKSRDDFAVAQGQQVFDVPVVEFDQVGNAEVPEVICNYRFTCPPNAHDGDRITVTFHYDRSGIITAEAVDQNTRQKLPVERMDYKEPDLQEVMRLAVRPRCVVFAIDASGSMSGKKLETAKQALMDNAQRLLAAGAGCSVGVVSFASRAEIVCRPTADFEEIRRTVPTMHANGGTAMAEGIEEAMQLVLSAPAGTDMDVTLLTDGMPNSTDRALSAAQQATARGITLSTIGIGQANVDEAFLKQLSPLVLVIESASGIGGGMATLLMQAAAHRRGLTES